MALFLHDQRPQSPRATKHEIPPHLETQKWIAEDEPSNKALNHAPCADRDAFATLSNASDVWVGLSERPSGAAGQRAQLGGRHCCLVGPQLPYPAVHCLQVTCVAQSPGFSLATRIDK